MPAWLACARSLLPFVALSEESFRAAAGMCVCVYVQFNGLAPKAPGVSKRTCLLALAFVLCGCMCASRVCLLRPLHERTAGARVQVRQPDCAIRIGGQCARMCVIAIELKFALESSGGCSSLVLNASARCELTRAGEEKYSLPGGHSFESESDRIRPAN